MPSDIDWAEEVSADRLVTQLNFYMQNIALIDQHATTMSEVYTFTPRQKALAIAPKGTAILSIIGSSWIIAEVLIDRRKRSTSYHQIMMFMSIADVVASFTFFLTTWPIPKNTPGAFWAVGTTETCTAQGFF